MVENKNVQIQSFKIKELFKSSNKYLIPIYQRNYAWQKAQVIQLVQDIADYSEINEDKTYYIGTLVVYKRQKKDGSIVYETIDGQQRLTTLTILLSILKNKYEVDFTPNPILDFESRITSRDTLTEIYENPEFDEKTSSGYNSTMKQAYIDIKNKLKEKSFKTDKFINFLLNKVEILRVCVPADTDLNHYFEIMNNRGEQLEKHEVLKARMMSAENLTEQDRIVFSKIWDACSDMSRYVQYGFNKSERKKIFGNKWNQFIPIEFDHILKNENNEPNTKSDMTNFSLEEIVNSTKKFSVDSTDNDKESSERFTSPINFQNFLLHVLRIQTGNKNDIALDDKRLIDVFSDHITDPIFIKTFGFNLLKAKYLLDNFILKRDYSNKTDDGEWSLKKLLMYKNENKETGNYKNSFDDSDNKQLIMLLSMFHVSNPSQNYKHWLSGAFVFLFKQKNINSINSFEYIHYLERQAKLFLMNGYLSDEETNYRSIIFNSELTINENVNKNLLNEGTKVENFIFNYLDYLLWKSKKGSYDKFSFTFKSSVEHVYPQHPKDGQEELKSGLDSFGNLCLISASKNSELSNYMPIAKKDHYHKTGYDSLKQELMMKKAENWNEDTIREHQVEMEIVLFNYGNLNESK